MMNKKATALDKAVTKAEAKMRKDGEMKKISVKYLEADYSHKPTK